MTDYTYIPGQGLMVGPIDSDIDPDISHLVDDLVDFVYVRPLKEAAKVAVNVADFIFQ